MMGIKEIKNQADLDAFCSQHMDLNRKAIKEAKFCIRQFSNYFINNPVYNPQTKADIQYAADILLKLQDIRETEINKYAAAHCQHKNE